MVPVLDFISDAMIKGTERQIARDIPRMDCRVNNRRMGSVEELKQSLNAIANGIYWLLAPLYHQGVMAEPLRMLQDSYDTEPYALCDGGEHMTISTTVEGNNNWELYVEKRMHVYLTPTYFEVVDVIVVIKSTCDDVIILFEDNNPFTSQSE